MTNFLTAKWENLIMANYSIEPEILTPYLPKGVELDFFEGKTYVSLVGFMFKNSKIFGIPTFGLGTFEEVNLRFYVTRKEGNITKRGVVFINETVPNLLVAKVANYFYKEHYIAIPSRHKWEMNDKDKEICYSWQMNNEWNNIKVIAETEKHAMATGSIEEFIFEHYFGYTKVSDNETIEYKINHHSWQINHIISHEINCNFEEMYGPDFGFLNKRNPNSIMLAEGSEIAVEWKRNRLML
jgi:uncharacterized protein